ncbi:MAG: beta strand repeat-containing protein [Bacteroidota bacterium]
MPLSIGGVAAVGGIVDSTPTITPVDGNGILIGQVTVDESGLASLANASETTTGSITVAAPAGLSSVTIGGTSFTAAQLAAPSYLAAHSIDTGEGILTLTGFSAGNLAYSYTLKGAVSQPGTAIDSLDNVTLTVTDVLGAINTGTLGVRIVDSLPVALDDSNSITEGTNSITVNALAGVLVNDTVIDVPVGSAIVGVASGVHSVFANSNVGVAVSGLYGSLVINADGSYTYTLNNANPTVNALNTTSAPLQDVFSYQLKDGDGDAPVGAAAQLTITINGSNDAPVVAGATVSGTEDTALTLTWANFGISDIDSPTITSATISALPSDGTLQVYNGSAWINVTAGDVVNKATVDAGYLRFVPDANESGGSVYATAGLGDQHVDYARFQVSVTDAGGATTVGNVTVDIAPVVDPVALALDASATGSVAGGNTITPPASVGLARDYYQALPGIGSTASSSAPNAAEVAIEAATPTSTSLIVNVGVAGAATTGGVAVAVDDAFQVRGLMYMEAGKSYAFSGYIDDTFRLEIGGTTVVSGQWGVTGPGSAGTFTATTYTPAVSGYYTVDLFVYNTSGPGSYDLNVAVNGGAVQDVSTTNFYLYPDVTALDTAGAQHNAFIANATTGEGGYYPAALNTGLEDTAIKLSALTPTFGDTADNSESHVVTISAIPVGAVLSDGTHTFTATAGNTSVAVWNEDSPASAFGGSNWDLGKLTVTPPLDYNGSFSLTATATATEISTGDSASATSSWAVTVDAVNDAPTVGTASAAVSEEGLPGGLPDTIGTSDTTDSATASGTISISDPDSSVTATLVAPTATITSAGVALTWSGSGTQTLIGSAGGVEVIRATIDNAGHYTVTLSKGIDQPAGNGENTSNIGFGVSVTDGVSTTTGTINVTVEDDSPVATNSVVSVAGTATETNLAITLDLSGSMGNASGLTGLTRLQATVAAVKDLIETYDSLGDVMVNITTFGTSATAGTWMTAANAKAFLDTVSANMGSTNYDAALAATMSAFASSGKLTGTNSQNVLYFLSDGAPNYGDGNTSTLTNATSSTTTSDVGIQSGEESIWTNFLSTNAVSAYAIGLGTGVTTATMDPVAYDGLTATDRNSVAVTDLNNLNSVLAGTVESRVTGTIAVGSGGAGGFGGDGGYMSAINYGNNVFSFDGANLSVSGAGTTAYSYNSTTHALTVTAAGGTFVIDMDTGAYTYTTAAAGAVSQEVFGYTLKDYDGDTSSGNLTINLSHYNNAPIGTDDNIIVQSSAVSANSVTIKDLWLTWNDSDAEGSPLSITSVSNATSHASGQVVDSVSASNAGTGAFSYLVSDGSSTDDAQVTIATQNSTTLTGNGLSNILVGGTSADTINGNEGNDVLVGNAGNDTLNGGTGNDLLIGGTGGDTMTGGAGADTFRWELGDATGTPSDRITDFNTAAPSAGGDILDLRDLLVGESHVGSDPGNLASYLHFTYAGGNTTINVTTHDGAATTQTIVLQGVNLGATGSNDAAVIQSLLTNGKLIVD